MSIKIKWDRFEKQKEWEIKGNYKFAVLTREQSLEHYEGLYHEDKDYSNMVLVSKQDSDKIIRHTQIRSEISSEDGFMISKYLIWDYEDNGGK